MGDFIYIVATYKCDLVHYLCAAEKLCTLKQGFFIVASQLAYACLITAKTGNPDGYTK